jgi:DNA-binding beta-propeller fold protein YncE
VYLSGQPGGIAVLARSSRDGRLRQLTGPSGCVRSDGRRGCLRVAGLDGLGAIAVSPDGRSVYVTTAHGILAFTRNRQTGAIRPLGGRGGCIDAQRRSCQPLRGITEPSQLVGAGAGTLYASGSGGVAAFVRNRVTGAVAQVPGAGGCLNDSGSQGCALAPCIYAETTVTLSTNRHYLYVGSTNSLDVEATAPGEVATFTETGATGALAYLGCATTTTAPTALVTRPNLDSVFVMNLYGNRGTGRASETLDLYAPNTSGQLSPQRTLVCLAYGCPIGLGPATAALAMTPDGNTAYAAFFYGGVAALRVGATTASPLPGHSGCVVSSNAYMPPARCARAGQQIGQDLTVSPDGRNLYVGTLGGSIGNYYAGGVETFVVQR